MRKSECTSATFLQIKIGGDGKEMDRSVNFLVFLFVLFVFLFFGFFFFFFFGHKIVFRIIGGRPKIFSLSNRLLVRFVSALRLRTQA